MPSHRRKYLLYLCMILAVVYSLSPIYNLFSISLMNPAQLVSGQLFPPAPNFNNFVRIMGFGNSFGLAPELREGLVNSIIVAVLVMTATILACVPAGYALGRLRIRGRMAMIGFLLGSRTLPPVAVALPFYFFFSAVGLRGTIPGIVLVQLSVTVPIVTWILMGFFSALPRDIEQQARADGCTRFQAFRYALLPLAGPGIAASAVIAFLFSWNDFFYSWLLTSGSKAQTYNTFLTAFGNAVGTAPQPTLFASAVVLQIMVAIVVAGFLQKYITSLKIVDPGTVIG